MATVAAMVRERAGLASPTVHEHLATMATWQPTAEPVVIDYDPTA